MRFFSISLLLFSSFALAQSYNNIELLDNWKNDNLITNSLQNRYNECWAFVHKGEEYAVIGSTEGTHIFGINGNNKLIEKGFVRGHYSNANVIHRDFKTYKNYLYAVCDEGESSLQIIDFSYLPDSVHLVANLDANFGRNHNIFIDSNTALLYCFSQKLFTNGIPVGAASMKVYSLIDPLNPVQVFNGFTDFPEVHDGLVKNNVAILNCGFDGLRRYDFSNPLTPIFLQNMDIYQDQGYNHQGDLSPSGDVYIFADETQGKRLKKCQFEPNGNLKIVSYFGTDINSGSVPHNIMLDDRFAYVAYYNSGLRIYDYRSTPVKEIAFYDTYPDDNTYKLNGLWGINSKLPSGRIVASDRKYGLFLFNFNRTVFANQTGTSLQVYPNPVSEDGEITLLFNEYFKGNLQIKIFDMSGRKVFQSEISHQNYLTFQPNLASGKYQLELTYEQNLESKLKRLPIMVF